MEGELIDNAYEIGNYLQTKNKFWKTWEKPADFRSESAKFFGASKSDLENAGFKITTFGNEEMK